MSRVTVMIVVTVFMLLNMVFTLYILVGGQYFSTVEVQLIYISIFVMMGCGVIFADIVADGKRFTDENSKSLLVLTMFMVVHSVVTIVAHYHSGVNGMNIRSYMVWAFVCSLILLELFILWILRQDICIRLTDE